MTTHERRVSIFSVIGITVFISLVSRMWTGLDTPDSSFYASLALFGDQVTDRAPFDSYYWTRLGYIAPVRGLISLTTPDIGFGLYRVLLIAIIVTSIYSIAYRFSRSARTASYLTMAVSLSSVMLSYLGNPYLTGSILAATCAVSALAMSHKIPAAIAAGIVLGWSAQVNPAGSLLVGTLFIAIGIFMRQRPKYFLFAAIFTAITFLVFIVIGTRMFPSLDWWETVNATRGITLNNFSSKSLVWLTDISLLVPLAVLIVSIKSWWLDRTNDAFRLALVISSVSISFLLVFSPIMGGIALEAPMYQAMLWPPAMIATALLFTNMTLNIWWVYALSIIAILGAGFLQPTLTFPLGIAIMLGMVLVMTVVRVKTGKKTFATVLALTIFIGSAQLLQNSRTDLGLYYLSPYSWAFATNPIGAKVSSAIKVQEWLLAKTNSTDQILTWVDGNWIEGDRELYVVAAMQLWGENRLTLEPEVDDYARAIVQRVKPNVIALYGRSQSAIDTMLVSLKENDFATSNPECIDFTWPEADNSRFPSDSGIACLSRLSLS